MFRYGSAHLAQLTPDYDDNPAHAFQRMLDRANSLAPGEPARMATRIIDSVEVDPAPLRVVLGSQALQSTIDTLRARLAGFETQMLQSSLDRPAALPARASRHLIGGSRLRLGVSAALWSPRRRARVTVVGYSATVLTA